jgi:hypothetical protein
MFFIPTPLMPMTQTALAVCRAVGTVRLEMTRVRIQRLVVLVLYVVVNLGVPIGDFAPKAVARQTPECRCSPESRAAGRCCCRSRALPPANSGCCANKSKSVAKSCCKKTTEQTKVAEPGTANPDEALALTGGCPCGPEQSPMMLICPQPRILSVAAFVGIPATTGGPLPADAGSPCGNRAKPLVPPPESPVV